MGVWALVMALLASITAVLPQTGISVRAIEVYELARPTPGVLAIHARAAYVLDLDSGAALYALNIHQRLAPASLTKVVTALVALNAMRLDQVVTVPAAINQLPWDSTRMGLRVGERLTVRDLLYGLFLNSGNDAAITLATAVMPQAAFVDRMNAQAVSLHMTDTHFVNPIGLDDPSHVTSAADLAKAARELETHDPEVAAMASVERLTIPATATHHAYLLYNLNELIRTYRGATGLKTGWTGHAGGCLIASATRDGRRLLAVVLGSPNVFKEAAALLDFGFSSAT